MDSQGVTYAAYVQSELDLEYARRDSMNARAATAITASTGLVTLVLAATAFVNGQNYPNRSAAELWMICGIGLLLAAAIIAILAGVSWKYVVTDETTLRAMIGDQWAATDVTARNTVASINIRTLVSLRAGTNIKTNLLLGAYALQTLSIAALLGAVISIVQ